MAVEILGGDQIEEAASLIAREQVAACDRQHLSPAASRDARRCATELDALLSDGYAGFVARDAGRCVGVMCGRTADSVGFVPAHGLAVDPSRSDPTDVVVALLAAMGPVLVADGAVRFTVDHVALDPLGAALNNTGLGRGGVFAVQSPRPSVPVTDVDIRIGDADDLDAIATLSQVELVYRATPPIYERPMPRTLAQARATHERLLANGAVHFLARRAEQVVGLVTVEFSSPAPRLCPTGDPYIGATATHPSMRGRGIGHALVRSVLNWAHVGGHETVAVDFDTPNPLSRPFWLGLGFEPTGYRLRRFIDPAFTTNVRPTT